MAATESPHWRPSFLPMGGHGFSPRFCLEASVIGRVLVSTRDLEAGRMRGTRRKRWRFFEAYDLTGSFRQAAVLAGCDHKTVARLVAAREAAGGGLPGRERRRPMITIRGERSRSWSIAPVGGSVLIRRIRSWSRWGIWVRSARRGGRSRRRSAVGARSTGGARDRGFRSRGCGCSGTMARGR